MSPTRFTWILTLTLTVAFPAMPSAQEPEKPPAPTKTTPAEELLDQAIKKMGSLEWLDTRFEQEGRSPGVKLTSSGRFVFAPKQHKLSYDLEVRVADAKGQSQVVCDGQTVWRTGQRRCSDPTVVQYSYAALQEARNAIDRSQLDPEKVDALLRDIEEENGFAGLLPMLQDLRKRLTFPKMETTTLGDGTEIYLLEGEWSPATRDKIIRDTLSRHGVSVPPEKFKDIVEAWDKRQEFSFLPRFVRVHLDRQSLWPLLIEWFGPMRSGGDSVLLGRHRFQPPNTTMPSEAEQRALFQLPPDLAQKAQKLDAKAIIADRRERLANQERMLQEMNRNRPLDPGTSGKP